MDELISKQALLRHCQKIYIPPEDPEETWCFGGEIEVVYLEDIENAPVISKGYGRWLSAYEYALKLGITDEKRLAEIKKDTEWRFCDDCGESVNGFHNYCPNCGLKMKHT